MDITSGKIAALLGGRLEGDGDIAIKGFAKIEEAQEGDLTFLANPKYTHHIYTSQASAVLVSDDFAPEQPVKATLIRVPDPYASLATLMRFYAAQTRKVRRGIEQPCHIAPGVEIPDDSYVGAYAYIGEGAVIGHNVEIFPQTYIGDGAVIGDGTVIRAGVRIYEGCRIGRNCIIHSGAVIGADGFGFAPGPEGYDKIPQLGIVVVEDDVEIGANTTVDRATFGVTVVGQGTKLDNLVQIGHNVRLGRHNVLCAQAGVAGSAVIGDWNRFGGQTGIAGHIKIGDKVDIGAQSGIHSDVASGSRLMGYPAVDFRQFARNVVYIKNLGSLYRNQPKNK